MNLIQKLREYLPLLCIVLSIIAFVIYRQYGVFNIHSMMYDFMGTTFMVFGAIKLLNWRGFVEAYQMYDLVAARSTLYAYLYPIFEVVLGYLFFMRLYVVPACIVTIILTGLSTLSVIKELRKDNPFPCACLGVVFVLPMTWVTLFENLFMMAMALVMLLRM